MLLGGGGGSAYLMTSAISRLLIQEITTVFNKQPVGEDKLRL